MLLKTRFNIMRSMKAGTPVTGLKRKPDVLARAWSKTTSPLLTQRVSTWPSLLTQRVSTWPSLRTQRVSTWPSLRTQRVSTWPSLLTQRVSTWPSLLTQRVSMGPSLAHAAVLPINWYDTVRGAESAKQIKFVYADDLFDCTL